MKTRPIRVAADGLISGERANYIDTVTFDNGTSTIVLDDSNEKMDLLFNVGDRILVSNTASNNSLFIPTSITANGMITSVAPSDEVSKADTKLSVAQPCCLVGIQIYNAHSGPQLYLLYNDITNTAGYEVARIIVPATSSFDMSFPSVYCGGGLYIDGGWTGTGTSAHVYIN